MVSSAVLEQFLFILISVDGVSDGNGLSVNGRGVDVVQFNFMISEVNSDSLIMNNSRQSVAFTQRNLGKTLIIGGLTTLSAASFRTRTA